MERGLSWLMAPYTAAEQAVIQGKLWQLLERQTQRYTMEVSASVRVETAQELLESLLYCLRLGLRGKENRRALLLHGDYPALVRAGLAQVDREIQAGLRRYQYLCNHPPAVTNRAYRDTVGDILTFFHRYNPQFLAHRVECSIDYQLFLPVGEELVGISYLNAYLSRLLLENLLLRRFSRGELAGCLRAATPDYEDLLVNLYEPVLQNSVALALLGWGPEGLSVSQAGRQQLQDLLEPLTLQERAAALEQAAARLWNTLDLGEPAAREYLRQSAATLAPRLDVALTHHTLEGMFVTF